MSEIRLLSLWQPWASLIAFGLKRYETRSWQTPYRGTIAIQASKRLIDDDGLETIHEFHRLTGKDLNVVDFKYPLGCIVAIVDLTDCLLMSNQSPKLVNPDAGEISIHEVEPLERAVGNWQSGRYAWKLENIRPIATPIPYRGKQGTAAIRDAAILEEIERQLAMTDGIEQQLGAIGAGGEG